MDFNFTWLIKSLVIIIFIFPNYLNAQKLVTEEDINFLLENYEPQKVYSEFMLDEDGQEMELIMYNYEGKSDFLSIRKVYVHNKTHGWSFHYYKGELIKASDIRAKSTSQFYYYYQNKLFSIIPSSKITSENTQLYKYATSLQEMSRKYLKVIKQKFLLSNEVVNIWLTNLEEALSQAKRKGQLILITFVDKSEYSKELEVKFFASEAFVNFAKEKKNIFLKLGVNERKLKSELFIDDYPTTLLIDSRIASSPVYYENYGLDNSVSNEQIVDELTKKITAFVPPIVDPFMAVKNGDLDLLTYAISKKYDLNKMKQHKTLVMLAAEIGNTEMVKMLEHKGADLTIKNKKGFTAYDYALMSGNAVLSEYIKQKQ